MPALRVAVIGTGAFGRNHLRVYRELEQAHPALVQLVALVDADETRRRDYAAEYGIPAFATVAHMLSALNGTGIDAASVCVPTLHHAATAELLLNAGID